MRASTLIPVVLMAASAAPALAAPIRGDYDSLVAREDYPEVYERDYFDEYYAREDGAGTGDAPAAPAAAPTPSTQSKDAGSDPAKTPSASAPAATTSAAAPAKKGYTPNIQLTGNGLADDLGNGLMKLLFGRSVDDAELLEARSFDDEDLYARDFDEDLYAREYDDELFERELDDEFWARGDEQTPSHQHSHHHNGIPPQANNPTKADHKELGVFPNHGEGAEAKEHTHADNSFSGAQHPMQGVHPKRAFIDELRERMDFYDELD